MARFLATLCTVGLLSMVAIQADAADPFRATSDSGVSSSSLDAMGLSGMRTMTRSESSQIRGEGLVLFGNGFALARKTTGSTTAVDRRTDGYRFSPKKSVKKGRGFERGFDISVQVRGGDINAFNSGRAWAFAF